MIAYYIPWELTILGLPLRPAISAGVMGRHRCESDRYGSTTEWYETASSCQVELHKSWGGSGQRVTGSFYGGFGLGKVYYFVELDQEEDIRHQGLSAIIHAGVEAQVDIPRFPDLAGGLVWMTTPHYGSSFLLTFGQKGNLLQLGLTGGVIIAVVAAVSWLR